jgi:D-alanine--(R)-lactate ligase
MGSRLRVAVLFGGRCEEHDVSVRSAIEIARHMDLDRYEPLFLGITRRGEWLRCERPGPDWEHGPCQPAVISPDTTTHGVVVLGDDGAQVAPVDVVFPVLHGRFGEDGAVQGLLELSGIPYVGCGVASSALCMDKALAHTVARSAGIATPTFRVLTAGDDADAVPTDMTLPVFVKPARSGSSFGVTRVEHGSELGAAIAEARRFDDKVVVEEAVAGTEVGCAVLGDGSRLMVGEVDQITLTHGFFRIHQEDRPEDGSANASITVPAAVPDELRDRIRDTAEAVYTALGCAGLARVDMFLQPDGRIVLNEVNTLPGFTAYSRYPRMMAAAGVSLADVIDRCLALATGG